LSDESRSTLDHLVLSDPLVSVVGYQSRFVSPVGFVDLVRLLDVGIVVGGPSSVFPIHVRHVDAVLVWLPDESAVNPNESVEPSALRSVLPDEDSRVVPVLTELRNGSHSGDHTMSEDWLVDPMVLNNCL
jgi:hypothetical protein